MYKCILLENITISSHISCGKAQQYTVMSCLFREQSKLLSRGAGDDLRTVA